MKVAFVHEYLNQFGGAERMLAELCALFPNAPIYTLLYDEKATRGLFRDKIIRTSFLQSWPLAKRHHQWYPLAMPVAIEQFDFSNFDLVISVSASFAKGIITGPKTKHICFCLTPPRFLWDQSQKFGREFGFPAPVRFLMQPFISYLRVWDAQAADRVDEFWAISNYIGERIWAYYRKPFEVIYPPVDTSKFQITNPKSQTEEYYLMVGRLVSYKKFDIAVQAFNKLGRRLLVVGTGPEKARLKRMAKKNVEFLGAADDDKLPELYARCRALVFPQDEDFGIVPLEAMASGRPVIAYRGGGALETVLEGRTGVFFDEQTAESLADCVRNFDAGKFDPKTCRAQAEKFDIKIFQRKILEILSSKP